MNQALYLWRKITAYVYNNNDLSNCMLRYTTYWAI